MANTLSPETPIPPITNETTPSLVNTIVAKARKPVDKLRGWLNPDTKRAVDNMTKQVTPEIKL